ncbi:hypothetical protein GF389_01570 [Candidatus Dojkabacteria bacterium]|nr:hypothetical protein [Candidatus Dojkabacteria bacterium]
MLYEIGETHRDDTGLIIPDADRYRQLIAGFAQTPNHQIGVIFDYDGTLTPCHTNSWDAPSILDEGWEIEAARLREEYRAGRMTEEEFMRGSFAYLQEHNLAERIAELKPERLPLRIGATSILQLASQTGANIVYSAEIGDLVEPHINYVADTIGIARPHVFANQIMGDNSIMGKTKDGNKLSQLAQQRGISLSDLTQLIIVGDSISDERMLQGLEFEQALKIGIISPEKAQDPAQVQR